MLSVSLEVIINSPVLRQISKENGSFYASLGKFLLPYRQFRETLDLPYVFSQGDFTRFPRLLGLVGKPFFGFLGRPLLWSLITSLRSSLFFGPEIFAKAGEQLACRLSEFLLDPRRPRVSPF